MKQDEKREQPTYEELVEFYQRHQENQGHLEHITGWALEVERKIAEDEVRRANLRKTWIGTLALLAERIQPSGDLMLVLLEIIDILLITYFYTFLFLGLRLSS